MFRLVAAYPATEGAKFDWEYYRTKHFDLVRETCEPLGLVATDAVQCLPGPDGNAPPYVAVANLDFESAEKFQKAFPVAAPVLMGDFPNFTDIQPILAVGPIHK